MRLYNKSLLNPEGTPEDETRCIKEVSDENGWHSFQCSRKRGYGRKGLYCKQHANMLKRRQDSIDKFNKKDILTKIDNPIIIPIIAIIVDVFILISSDYLTFFNYPFKCF